MHDLLDVTAIDLNEPIGWVTISLNNSMLSSPVSDPGSTETPPSALRTHFLQVQVHTMHQNGRDTHIRQVKVFGPRPVTAPLGTATSSGRVPLDFFRTTDMTQFGLLR